jgi:hypothetical protein
VSAAEQVPVTAPEPYEVAELDDETVEQLRRLLFGINANESVTN